MVVDDDTFCLHPTSATRQQTEEEEEEKTHIRNIIHSYSMLESWSKTYQRKKPFHTSFHFLSHETPPPIQLAPQNISTNTNDKLNIHKS